MSSWREELAGVVVRLAMKVSGLGMAGTYLEGEWRMEVKEISDWLLKCVEELNDDEKSVDEKSIKETHQESHNESIKESIKDSHNESIKDSINNTHKDSLNNKSINDKKPIQFSHKSSINQPPQNNHNSHNQSQPSQEFTPLLSMITSTSTHLHTLNETLGSLLPFTDLATLSSLITAIPAGIQTLTRFESFCGILATAGKCRQVADRLTAETERLQERVKKLREEETALRRWSNVETEIPNEWSQADVMKLPREKVEIMEQALQRGLHLFNEWNRGDFNEQIEAYLGNMRRIVEETAEMLRERGKMCVVREGRNWREE